MIKSRHIIPFIASILLAFSSCTPETIKGNVFEASLELETKSIHGGEDFVFTVRCNRSSFIVESYDCDFTDRSIISAGSTYNVTDGKYTFTIPAVDVDEAFIGVLALSVRDPETGAVVDWRQSFNAFLANSIRLSLNASSAAGSYVSNNDDIPVIIEGDELILTFETEARSLTVVDFDCDFATGIIRKGDNLRTSGGVVTRSLGPATVTEERIATTDTPGVFPAKMSFTFRDTESGEEVKAGPLYYYCLKKFSPRAEIVGSVKNGEPLRLRIWSSPENRRTVTLVGCYSDLGTLSFTQDGEDLYNETITMGIDGYADIVSKEALSIAEDYHGTLRLVLSDSFWTGRQAAPIVLDYDAFADKDVTASSIVADDPNQVLYVTCEQQSTLSFTVTPENSVGNVVLELSDYTRFKGINDRLVAPIENGRGSFTLTGGYSGGGVTATLFLENNPKIKTTKQVYVRHRVALLVSGTFAYSSRSYNSHCWFGMPETMSVQLVTWDGDLVKGGSYHAFNGQDDPKMSFDIFVDASPTPYVGCRPYAAYSEGKTYPEREKYTKAGSTSNWDRHPHKTVTIHDSTTDMELIDRVRNLGSGKANVSALLDVLQKYNNYVNFGWWSWSWYGLYIEYNFVHHDKDKCPDSASTKKDSDWDNYAASWTKFRLAFRNFDYDRERFDFRGVIHDYRAKATGSRETDYWWKASDRTADKDYSGVWLEDEYGNDATSGY